MDAIMQWGISLVLALQNIGGLGSVMQFFTFLGQEEFFLFVMPVVYWCVDAGLGARLAVVLVTSNVFKLLLKLAFHLPRPYWIDRRVLALAAESSYGLPSGHAQDAVAIWGFVAAQLRRPWTWAAALVLVFLISLSRVYLGVHFPTDVLGGWVSGGIFLFAFVRWEQPVTAWLRHLNLWPQIALAFGLSLVYLALTGGALALIAPTPDPAEWEQTAVAAVPPEDRERAYDPRRSEDAVTVGGLIFGLGAALALASRHARFNAGGAWAKRAARFVAGVTGILILWLGLALVFPDEPFWLAMIFRYARYAVTIFWALFLAPWAFLKIGLAGPQPG